MNKINLKNEKYLYEDVRCQFIGFLNTQVLILSSLWRNFRLSENVEAYSFVQPNIARFFERELFPVVFEITSI